MRQDELTPDWLALRHRLTFALRRLRGGSQPALRHSRRDLRSGGADRARPPPGELHYALPKKSFYAVHAEPKLFFEPSDFSALIGDPGIIGLAHFAERPRQPAAGSRQPLCLGRGSGSWLEPSRRAG